MKNPITEAVQSTVKNWWLSLIVGILFLFAGFWMLFEPVGSYIAIAMFFVIFMFLSGIFEIAFAISNSKIRGWGWYLTGGIIDLLLGTYLVCNPGLAELVIPFVIAFWLMFRGFSAIGISSDMNQAGIKGWGWYVTLGILAIICSILMIWQPLSGAFFAVYMVAFAFLFIGLFRIMLALRMKDIHKKIKDE